MAYARSYFLGYSDRDPNLEGLAKFYVEWRDYPEYLVVQKQSDNLRIEGKIDREARACLKAPTRNKNEMEEVERSWSGAACRRVLSLNIC